MSLHRAPLGDGSAQGYFKQQVDAVTPAGIVDEERSLDQITETALADYLPRAQGLVEEAVVEHHRCLSPGGVRVLEDLASREKILLTHVRLPIPGNQGFLKENSPGVIGCFEFNVDEV